MSIMEKNRVFLSKVQIAVTLFFAFANFTLQSKRKRRGVWVGREFGDRGMENGGRLVPEMSGVKLDRKGANKSESGLWSILMISGDLRKK